MNDAATHASRHPALRRILATATAARAIERTAHRFSHRPPSRSLGGQPKEPTYG